MPVFDLYSKRKKLEAAAGQSEVYQYDVIPEGLRAQIVMIWEDALGQPQEYGSEIATRAWSIVRDTVKREKGKFSLSNERKPKNDCINYLMNFAETDDVLDILEVSFTVICNIHRRITQSDLIDSDIKISAEDAVSELNVRFREHSVGYYFENGRIFRIDSQLLHAEVVKPALALLHDPMFKEPNTEFLLAHEHYRHGKHADAVVAAQRAFESVMKCILAAKQVPFDLGDRSAELIKAVRRAGILPDYLEAGFDTYIAMLKTGLPSVRNNAGGHGRAPDTPATPAYIARYAIYMAATNIVLLVEAFKSGKG